MAKITGLGGVFLKTSGDSKVLLEWYKEVLGLDVSEYGINFLAPNVFTLITFNSDEHAKTVLNFTVDHLDEMMVQLLQKKVKILKQIETVDFGKFAQIEDVLGNTVELWEPFEDVYIEMVNKEVLGL